MRDHRKLRVYGKALALALRVNEVAHAIPGRRFRNLAEQLSAATESIPANIQEGCSESSRREFARFLQIALASAGEVAHHLEFARNAGAISNQLYHDIDNANTEVRRMLARLLSVVRDELSTEDDETSIAAMQRRRTVRRAKENDPSKKPESL